MTKRGVGAAIAIPQVSKGATSMNDTSQWIGRLLLEKTPDDCWAVMGRAVTFGELHSAVEAIARDLAAAGVASGDSVAVCLSPGLTLLQTIMAVWSIGGQVMPIDARSTRTEIKRCMRLGRPGFLVRPQDPGDLEGGPRVHCAIAIEPQTDPCARNGVCLVQFSSGSTGQPKMIGRSIDALVREVEVYARLDGMPVRGERALILNSQIHTMGLIGGVLHALNAGAQIVLPVSQGIVGAGGGVDLENVDAIFGVPVHFDIISRAASLHLPSLRLAVSAGERLRREVYDRFTARFGIPVSPVYGTTETGIVAADLAGSSAPPSVGKVVDGVEVEIRDGEVCVALPASPYLTPEGAERYVGGWLRTCDRAERDAAGELVLLGRSDSVAVVGGMNVDLNEVEEVLAAHPSVSEVLVLADESITAYIGAGGEPVTPGELMDWCREHLSGFKIPRAFHITVALARTRSGKIVRRPEVQRAASAAVGSGTRQR